MATVFIREWRYLEGPRRDEIVAERRRYEERLRTLFREGRDLGELRADLDDGTAALLLLSAGNWAYTWLRPGRDTDGWPAPLLRAATGRHARVRDRHAAAPGTCLADTTGRGRTLSGVDSAALVDRLTKLGLTSYEAKSYLALIRRDSSTAAQVARVSGVPRQRIYDVLATLVEKGLASAAARQRGQVRATAPDIALGGPRGEPAPAAGEIEQAPPTWSDELQPAFAAGQEHTDPLEYIEVLRDRRAINERFGELQAGIKQEILVFTKPPYATPAQENVEGLEVAASHRARSVYEFSAFDDPEFVEGVRRFIEAGEEARFVPELPLKLVIIDETIVMFGMEDPVAGRVELTLMVVEHPSLAKILKIAFDAVWATGLTFDQAYDRLVTRRAKTA